MASARRTKPWCRSWRTEALVWSTLRPHALKAEHVGAARSAKAALQVELAAKGRPFELAEYPVPPIHHLHAAIGGDRPAEPTIPHGIAPNPEAAHRLIGDAQTATGIQRHRGPGIVAAAIPEIEQAAAAGCSDPAVDRRGLPALPATACRSASHPLGYPSAPSARCPNNPRAAHTALPRQRPRGPVQACRWAAIDGCSAWPSRSFPRRVRQPGSIPRDIIERYSCRSNIAGVQRPIYANSASYPSKAHRHCEERSGPGRNPHHECATTPGIVSAPRRRGKATRLES